jgi:hypothetical protein
MKTTVDFYDFREAFRRYDRVSNFPNSLKSLFDYLEEYESDCGTEVELDVVGLCCEYEENNFSDLPAYYTGIDLPDVAGFTDDETGEVDTEGFEDAKIDAILEYLEENTMVCGHDRDAGWVLYQQF